jgi:PTH1 family peptidyl-tRNA hydrolase
MKLVIGIGNPGKEYAPTRHNLGFRVVDALAARYRIACDRRRFRARLGRGRIGAQDVLLLKPQTYVNESGTAVRRAVDWYGLAIADLLVICDDFALPLGQLRTRRRGRSGGHKGLESIARALGTEEYARLRLGIGARAQGRAYDRDYVLSGFEAAELPAVELMVADAADAAVVWLEQGVEACMMKTNRREAKGPPQPRQEDPR